jgi:Relaxase/Mobilisation nuclease domain
MIDTADEVIAVLGLQDHQAVFVEHTDEPHPHVHLCVNLIHPETGKTASLSKDAYKLERWADNYELRMGVIRSPERRAKFRRTRRRPETCLQTENPETLPGAGHQSRQ